MSLAEVYGHLWPVAHHMVDKLRAGPRGHREEDRIARLVEGLERYNRADRGDAVSLAEVSQDPEEPEEEAPEEEAPEEGAEEADEEAPAPKKKAPPKEEAEEAE